MATYIVLVYDFIVTKRLSGPTIHNLLQNQNADLIEEINLIYICFIVHELSEPALFPLCSLPPKKRGNPNPYANLDG